MSDRLAASLERLYNAHHLVPDVVPDVVPDLVPDLVPDADAQVAPDLGPEPEPLDLPAQALASRRLGAAGRTRTDHVSGLGAWEAAAQGRIAALADAQQGRPRLALTARAALAAAFALLALGGGVFSAHLLSASALPTTIISSSTEAAAEPLDPLTGGPTLATGATVVVHVAGAVAQPGITELPAGSRVANAVEQAGGAVEGADLSAINLARVLVDGEQILIPLAGQQLAEPLATPVTPPLDLTRVHDESGLINLNHASIELLQELPGIGPALAGRVIEYRNQIGSFTNIEQLQEVSGIGPAVMSNVRDKVTV